MRVVEPLALHDQLAVQVAEVGDGSAERSAAQPQKGGRDFDQARHPDAPSAPSSLDCKDASSDHAPAPTRNRKIEPSSIARSVRASCSMLQRPLFGPEGFANDK